MGWLKLYYRDNQKVMRSIEGVRILVVPGSDPVMIYLDESVYTLESHIGARYWFDRVGRRDDATMLEAFGS
jgi:hypothetical protein